VVQVYVELVRFLGVTTLFSVWMEVSGSVGTLINDFNRALNPLLLLSLVPRDPRLRAIIADLAVL